jgi:nucleoside-diphosphate-sugar epimerase
MTRRVAVLGADGFVGRHLVRAMSKNTSIEVEPFARSRIDLTHPETLNVLSGGVDCVIHAAGLIDGTREELFSANVRHVEKLVRHCQETSIRSLIYLSTGGVYGVGAGLVTANSPCKAVGSYAESKLEAERLLRANFGGCLNILRLFYPYGADQREPRLLPRLLHAANNRQPVDCGEDGGPRLNLGHVDDLCKIVIDDFVVVQSQASLVNLASDVVLPLREIFTSICRYVGKPPNLLCSGLREETVSVPYGEGRWRKFEPSLLKSEGDV